LLKVIGLFRRCFYIRYQGAIGVYKLCVLASGLSVRLALAFH